MSSNEWKQRYLEAMKQAEASGRHALEAEAALDEALRIKDTEALGHLKALRERDEALEEAENAERNRADCMAELEKVERLMYHYQSLLGERGLL